MASSTRPPTGIADPQNPENAFVPAFARCEAITKSDATVLSPTSGLMVNVAGDLALLFENSAASVILTVLAGVVYEFRVTKVLSTGTDATGIFAFYQG